MRKQTTSKREIKRRLGNLPSQQYSSKLWACLRSYALVLLESHTMNCDLLIFLFSLLDPDSLSELVCSIFPMSEEDLVDELDDYDLLAHRTYKKIGKGNISAAKLKKMLKDTLKNCRFKFQGIGQEQDFEEPLKTLAAFFELSSDEVEIIKFYYCLKQSIPLNNIIEDLTIVNNLQMIALCTGLPLNTVKANLQSKSKMLACRIIFDISRNAPFFELNSLATDYISGLGGDVPLSEQFARVVTAEYPLESFSVPQQATDIITGLLNSDAPCHILLFGEQGTGKSEYAKSVVTACGMKAFFVQYGVSDDVDDRYFTICGATQSMGKDGIIIVDESDQLLNTDLMFFISSNDSSIEKGYLNTFLTNCKSKVIWITNKIDCIPPSVKRRFSYSFHFKPFTMVEREKIWNQHLHNNALKALIPPTMVKELSRKHQVNAAAIGSALTCLRSILNGKPVPDTERVRDILNELLTKHLELIQGKEIKQKLAPLTQQYDLEALNLDTEPQKIIESLQGFIRKQQNAGTKALGVNCNLLFWGTPGTGKSEFCKYLAQQLRRELVIKRASDLVSCFVGQTERAIKKAFDEAQRQEAILFLDEADSFFTARESAKNTWEVSQTNELLSQLENFQGIFVCCTNLLESIDKAALRRFQFKILFKPLTVAGKRLLFQRYFNNTELTPDQMYRLESINLTAGDYKTVFARLQYLPDDNIQPDGIIQALANEARYKAENKGESIGF